MLKIYCIRTEFKNNNLSTFDGETVPFNKRRQAVPIFTQCMSVQCDPAEYLNGEGARHLYMGAMGFILQIYNPIFRKKQLHLKKAGFLHQAAHYNNKLQFLPEFLINVELTLQIFIIDIVYFT